MKKDVETIQNSLQIQKCVLSTKTTILDDNHHHHDHYSEDTRVIPPRLDNHANNNPHHESIKQLSTLTCLRRLLATYAQVHCDGGNDGKSSGKGAHQDNASKQNLPHSQLTNNERVATSLVSGALAGGVAKTVIAPLDRTKIFFQTTPTAKFNINGVFNHLYDSYKSNGLKSLWRGNSATMARIVPYAAIQFTAHEQWKRIFKVDVVVDNNNAQQKNHQGSNPRTSNTSTPVSHELTRFLCGSLAGITAQSLTYPLDLTRARLAVSEYSKYTGLNDVFIKTVRGEGLAGLYKGYVPTMLGVIPYAGCSFYCYEGLKRVWVREFGEGSVGGVERLVFGAFSGVVGQSSSYPFDIVRRRLQTGVDRGSSNVFRLMVEIGRSEGIIKGLYKGLSMNWVKGPVAAGISFACYDWVNLVLRDEIFKYKRKRVVS